jgi:hypothetical protein
VLSVTTDGATPRVASQSTRSDVSSSQVSASRVTAVGPARRIGCVVRKRESWPSEHGVLHYSRAGVFVTDRQSGCVRRSEMRPVTRSTPIVSTCSRREQMRSHREDAKSDEPSGRAQAALRVMRPVRGVAVPDRWCRDPALVGARGCLPWSGPPLGRGSSRRVWRTGCATGT